MGEPGNYEDRVSHPLFLPVAHGQKVEKKRTVEDDENLQEGVKVGRECPMHSRRSFRTRSVCPFLREVIPEAGTWRVSVLRTFPERLFPAPLCISFALYSAHEMQNTGENAATSIRESSPPERGVCPENAP